MLPAGAVLLGVAVGVSTRSVRLIAIFVVLFGAMFELAEYMIALHQQTICFSFDGAPPCTSSTPVVPAAHLSFLHWLFFCGAIAVGACAGFLIRKWRQKTNGR